MKITVVGGGNIGTQFIVHCAEKGHDVVVYTSVPEIFERHISIVDENGVTTHEGDIKLATKDPRIAFGEADLIFVTVPPTMMDSIACLVYKYASKKTMIGVVPGNGGSECSFRNCIERGNIFFGIERVPAIARLVEKGRTVRSIGYRNILHVASFPRGAVEMCCDVISKIFEIPCLPIPTFLNLTLTPSNPILHTSRLRSLFSNYKEGVIYLTMPLFYEEWDDSSSELLLASDEEVQMICKALPQFQLGFVKSLREHYESFTVEQMTKKISNIPAFKGLLTPTVKVSGGMIPDLHSRYFTSDFSYGLNIIQQVARFAEVKTPNIDATMCWYKSIALEKKEFSYSAYGINSKETFEAFYAK